MVDGNLEAIAVNLGMCYNIRTAIIRTKSGSDRFKGFEWADSENRLLSLKAHVVYEIMRRATALLYDV